VQECLNNIVKHSRAKLATIKIKKDNRQVKMIVQDDGCGFSPENINTEAKGGGFGLTGMAERVRMLGGTQTISSAPDGGTEIMITVVVKENE